MQCLTSINCLHSLAQPGEDDETSITVTVSSSVSIYYERDGSCVHTSYSLLISDKPYLVY